MTKDKQTRQAVDQQAKKQQPKSQPATDQDLNEFSEDDAGEKELEADLSQKTGRGGGGSATQ